MKYNNSVLYKELTEMIEDNREKRFKAIADRNDSEVIKLNAVNEALQKIKDICEKRGRY